MSARNERVARNEVLFRDANERIEQLAQELGEDEGEPIAFFCECGDRDCTERIEVTTTRYEAVRGVAERFFVMPGHNDPRVERVVEDAGRFMVVEKVGEAAEVAAENDPRS